MCSFPRCVFFPFYFSADADVIMPIRKKRNPKKKSELGRVLGGGPSLGDSDGEGEEHLRIGLALSIHAKRAEASSVQGLRDHKVETMNAGN